VVTLGELSMAGFPFGQIERVIRDPLDLGNWYPDAPRSRIALRWQRSGGMGARVVSRGVAM